MVLKNEKHEKFCQVYHKTGNKSEAYRQAYPKSLKWKDKTVHSRGSELSRNGMVEGRIAELKIESNKIADKAFTVDIEQRLKWLDEVAKAGLDIYSDQNGNNRRENLAATCKAVDTLNSMLGISEQGEKTKPVKVFVGVEDAS